MERRLFLRNLVASAIGLVAYPKIVKAEDKVDVKKEFWKKYPLTYSEAFKKGNSGDVLGKNGWEPSSQCIIEDGFILLYTTQIVRPGDHLITDVFYNTLRVVSVLDEALTDIGFVTKYKLYPMDNKKICGRPVIEMANGKLKLFKKGHPVMPCNFTVAFSAFGFASLIPIDLVDSSLLYQ